MNISINSGVGQLKQIPDTIPPHNPVHMSLKKWGYKIWYFYNLNNKNIIKFKK